MKEVVDKIQGRILLCQARNSIGSRLGIPAEIDSDGLDDSSFLQECGTFVTLTLDGALRGCIGNLEPSGTILESVKRNAISAAFHDHRFKPLTLKEFKRVEIHISILSVAERLYYDEGSELLDLIQPHVDGVILCLGRAKATFLPQVWSQLPSVKQFLEQLCLKAGLSRSAWIQEHPEVYLYQVQSIEEER
jgi:AmmeMemoRadiSam system protein A